MNRDQVIKHLKDGAEICESVYTPGYALVMPNGMCLGKATEFTYNYLRNNRLIERAYNDGFRRRWKWRGEKQTDKPDQGGEDKHEVE